MGDLSSFYDVSDEPNDVFQVLPECDVTMAIVASEWKQNAKKTGKYLQLDFQVLSGEHKNQKVFVRLNLGNPSEMAVKIARGTLACIRTATGVMSPGDSSDLHDIPMLCHVVCKKRNDGEGFSNDISKYSKEDAMPGDEKNEKSKNDVPW